jgi:hypothetical protein
LATSPRWTTNQQPVMGKTLSVSWVNNAIGIRGNSVDNCEEPNTGVLSGEGVRHSQRGYPHGSEVDRGLPEGDRLAAGPNGPVSRDETRSCPSRGCLATEQLPSKGS